MDPFILQELLEKRPLLLDEFLDRLELIADRESNKEMVRKCDDISTFLLEDKDLQDFLTKILSGSRNKSTLKGI